MTAPDPTLLAELLGHAPDGVAVARGTPLQLVYANATLAGLLRVPEATLQGRLLDEIEAETPADTNATGAAMVMRVQLKRGDGTTVACERWMAMLRDGSVALHYRPLQRAANGAVLDRASGLATAEHLHEIARRDWSIGQRDGRSMTLLKFDVDASRDYHEVFGRVATENVLRQVGRTVASAMRRTSDVVARTGEDEFVALGAAMEQASACAYADTIIARVRALAIHHPRSPTGRYLTVSAGVVTAVPPRDLEYEALFEAVDRAVAQAKATGGNRAAGGAL